MPIFRRRFLDEKLKPGYVVGIKNGQVSKYTDDASEILLYLEIQLF